MPHGSRSAADRGRRIATSRWATLALSVADGLSAAEAQRRERAEISAALRGMGPVVYGVLTTDGLVKFGHSTNLPVRLAAYGIGVKNAKRLLMVKAGTLVDEQIVLARFGHHLARGREYFHPAREILDYINEHRAAMGVPALPL